MKNEAIKAKKTKTEERLIDISTESKQLCVMGEGREPYSMSNKRGKAARDSCNQEPNTYNLQERMDRPEELEVNTVAR